MPLKSDSKLVSLGAWLSGLDISLAQRWSRAIRSIENPVGSKGELIPALGIKFWPEVIEVIKQRDGCLPMVRGPEIQEAEKILDTIDLISCTPPYLTHAALIPPR